MTLYSTSFYLFIYLFIIIIIAPCCSFFIVVIVSFFIFEQKCFPLFILLNF
ncbi:unnamed protein product [Schistosoma mattheei]|uniref:Uncharacterized protein n=1 Tax=Schistosoma mattheei TaxID=31246 RepID=A0A183P798_9TREM|nr:unnamed protein product [Schistosoma mattheei]